MAPFVQRDGCHHHRNHRRKNHGRGKSLYSAVKYYHTAGMGSGIQQQGPKEDIHTAKKDRFASVDVSQPSEGDHEGGNSEQERGADPSQQDRSHLKFLTDRWKGHGHRRSQKWIIKTAQAGNEDSGSLAVGSSLCSAGLMMQHRLSVLNL